MHKTKTVIRVVLPLLLLVMLAGCRRETKWFGGQPRSAAMFCDFEQARTCATQEDLMLGIDIAKPDEDGFWKGRSSQHGLDYSPEALAQCGGLPIKVQFVGPYPQGTPVCMNPARFDAFPDGAYSPITSIEEGCADVCFFDDNCEFLPGRASHRAADGPFLGACTDAGTLSPSFRDPRRIHPPVPVTWVDAVGVAVNGASLTKTSTTSAFDAGAAASTILPNGFDGYFEFIAIETNTTRTAGFAIGPLPDTDPSDTDIVYGVALQPGGIMTVVENGQPIAAASYAPNDRIRIGVFTGRLQYFKNGQLITLGSPRANTALRVSVSLRDVNATIAAAITTF